MKLTKAKLKEIIEEELGEVIRPHQITPGIPPRRDIPPVRPGELRPHTPEMAPEQPEGPVMIEVPINTLQDLYGMIKAEHDVSGADNQTPDRVTKSLSRIAGTLAGLL